MTPYQLSDHPALWDDRGKAVSVAGAMLAPNALNVAQVFQQQGKLYLSKWDEAMRDSPENALAMQRDAFYLSLIQERTAPTINVEWEVKVQDEDDPIQKLDGEIMQRAWDELPQKTTMMTWLMHSGVFIGRSGQQGVWGKSDSGLKNWIYHEPVHGDSIQYQIDGTPVILVNFRTAERIRATDPDAIITATDRGAYGLRLYRPEYRRRFLIYKHNSFASDYFEGEMSGGVHGVGLRSWLYWGDFIRRDTLAGMVGFVNNVGMMDIVVINYPDGNAAAEARAKENAKKISDKIAFVCPRNPDKEWPAMETYPFNSAGVQVMKELIQDMYDKYAERLIVGQEMSTGGGSSGLEGDGKADFAKDTKFQLVKSDAKKCGEMLTRDWLVPCRNYNRPGSTTPMQLVAVLEDPREKVKAQNVTVCVEVGIEIEEDEARRAFGFRKPRDGKKTIGKKEPPTTRPGMPPTDPSDPPDPKGDPGARPPKFPVPNVGKELDTLSARFEQLMAYVTDDKGHDHSASDGKFTGKGESGGRASTPDEKKESDREDLEYHEGAEPVEYHVDHENYLADLGFSSSEEIVDHFRMQFRGLLAAKDSYAAQAAEYAGAGESFKTQYAERRAELVEAGESYKDALTEMTEAYDQAGELKAEIDSLKQSALEVDDYGNRPAKPNNPEKMDRWNQVMADFQGRKAAAIEKAKQTRRGEIAEVRARLAEPMTRYKAARKAARISHAGIVSAAQKINELIRPLHGGQSNYSTDAHGNEHSAEDGKFVSKGGGGSLGIGGHESMTLNVPDPEGDDAFDVKVWKNPSPEHIASKVANLRPRQRARGIISGDDIYFWWEEDVHHQTTAKAIGIKNSVSFEDRLFISRDRDTGETVIETHSPNPRIAAWAESNGFRYGDSGQKNYDASQPVNYASEQAPVGGVTVQGRFYVGGQFIPSAVVAKATAAERKAIKDGTGKGGGEGTDPKAPEPVSSGRATTRHARKATESTQSAGKEIDIARSRMIRKAHKVEREVAEVMEGYNLADSEPADILIVPEVDEGGRPTGRGSKFAGQGESRSYLAQRARVVARMNDPATEPEERERIRAFLNEKSALTFVEVKTLQKAGQNRVRMTGDALAKKQKWEAYYGGKFVTVVKDIRKGAKYSGHDLYLSFDIKKTITLEECVKVKIEGGKFLPIVGE